MIANKHFMGVITTRSVNKCKYPKNNCSIPQILVLKDIVFYLRLMKSSD